MCRETDTILNMSKFSLKSLLGLTDKNKKYSEKVVPPVDLNKPVENPECKAAISEFIKSGTKLPQIGFLSILNKANYLIAVLIEPTPEKDSQAIKEEFGTRISFKPGTVLKLLSCTDPEKNNYLAVFTDWEEIKKFTNVPVNTLVMPGKDLWAFALKDNLYKGIIINPSGIPIRLNNLQMEHLLKLFNTK
jgi:hypothetical protein